MVTTSGSGIRLTWSESLVALFTCATCLTTLGLNSPVCKMGIVRAHISQVRIQGGEVCEGSSPQPTHIEQIGKGSLLAKASPHVSKKPGKPRGFMGCA